MSGLTRLWIDTMGLLTANPEDGLSLPLYSATDVDALLTQVRAYLDEIANEQPASPLGKVRVREAQRLLAELGKGKSSGLGCTQVE